MTLTVACVWVNGHVPFTVEYVTKLHAMCQRWIQRDFRFVCLTDRPAHIPAGIHPIVIASPGKLKGWWSKVELWNPNHGLTGRVLYLDLDTLIVNTLDEIIDYPAPFALAPHAGTFNGKDGLQVVKRFNSSVMSWDAGTQDHVWKNWTPKVAHRLWGDQDHIGEQAPFAVAMPVEWFPRLSEVNGGWPDEAKVVLCKKPKNVDAAKTIAGFAEAWG
jgi:hypothetical protein